MKRETVKPEERDIPPSSCLMFHVFTFHLITPATTPPSTMHDLAGIAIGPHTPGFIGNLAVAQQLSEVGVILLMFGVGLHFRLDDLLAVRNVAVPGAIGQSIVTTL